MVNVTTLVFFLDRQKAYMQTKGAQHVVLRRRPTLGKRMDENQM